MVLESVSDKDSRLLMRSSAELLKIPHRILYKILRSRIILVPHPFPDDMPQSDPMLRQRLLHHIGRLLL